MTTQIKQRALVLALTAMPVLMVLADVAGHRIP
jgi:hypothetical protein